METDERTMHRGIMYLSRSLRKLKTFQCILLAFYFFYSVVGARQGQTLVPILVIIFDAGWLKAWLIPTGMFDPSPHSRLNICPRDWRRQVEGVPDSLHHVG